jgi:hypothetical protein
MKDFLREYHRQKFEEKWGTLIAFVSSFLVVGLLVALNLISN